MLARSLPNLSMIKPRSDTLLLAVDFAGTFVFAMEGGMAAARANLDLLGVMVLAFATALGGGIIRDLLSAQSLRAPSPIGGMQPSPSRAVSRFFSSTSLSRRFPRAY
jgi:hypothetical protein